MDRFTHSKTIELYSQLLNVNIQKTDEYWDLFFKLPYNYVPLNSTFANLRVDQILENHQVLHILFLKALDRLKEVNALEILRIFIRNISLVKNNRNEVYLKIFGDYNELSLNFSKLLKNLKLNMSIKILDKELQITSLELFVQCVRAFYGSICFEFFYELDLSLEIEFFLNFDKNKDFLNFKNYGDILSSMSILYNNNLISTNFYKNHLFDSKISKNKESCSNINSLLKKLLITIVDFYEQIDQDLLVKQEQHSTFFNWFTGNRFNTKIQDYHQLLEEALTQDDDADFNEDEIDHLKALVIHRLEKLDQAVAKNNNILKNNFIPFFELLPVTTYLYSFIINDDNYRDLFTKRKEQKNEIKIENEEEKPQLIDLFEIFLSLVSFVAQYQHDSINENIMRLFLLMLNKIIASNNENLKNYFINQYQIKICSQKNPIIKPVGSLEYFSNDEEENNNNNNNNNNNEENPFISKKNSFYYILDILQCQLRFNLTKNLDLINFKLTTLMILRILNNLLNFNLINDYYNWTDFFNTFFGVLIFIKKYLLLDKFEELKFIKIGSLVEEFFLIMEFFLINFNNIDNKNIIFELIYKILENNDILLKLLNHYLIKNTNNFKKFIIIYDFLKKNFIDRGLQDKEYSQIYSILTLEFEKNQEFFINNNDQKSFQIGDEDYLISFIENDNLNFESETFKYFRKKNSIYTNSKITLINQDLDHICKYDRMFL